MAIVPPTYLCMNWLGPYQRQEFSVIQSASTSRSFVTGPFHSHINSKNVVLIKTISECMDIQIGFYAA